MLEHFFYCPYCMAQISMLLDASVVKQSYVEDCEVCCNPIRISFMIDAAEGTLSSFEAQQMD
ncbi:CPXCG motif-containing cysteine-rich protein [Catalinimonas sp. 4WD22]|uniref:CPXCG motif-containing cysteine-rich protein n=1 Tax=Catalinimonas locisalis TaxID=3133978 RepID=UPI0031014C8C